MNIQNKEHRQKILESCHTLPALKPIGEGQAPESVGEWLRSLHLDQYVDVFRRNGYVDMERAKKVWDVELKSVSMRYMFIFFSYFSLTAQCKSWIVVIVPGNLASSLCFPVTDLYQFNIFKHIIIYFFLQSRGFRLNS